MDQPFDTCESRHQELFIDCFYNCNTSSIDVAIAIRQHRNDFNQCRVTLSCACTPFTMAQLPCEDLLHLFNSRITGYSAIYLNSIILASLLHAYLRVRCVLKRPTKTLFRCDTPPWQKVCSPPKFWNFARLPDPGLRGDARPAIFSAFLLVYLLDFNRETDKPGKMSARKQVYVLSQFLFDFNASQGAGLARNETIADFFSTAIPVSAP